MKNLPLALSLCLLVAALPVASQAQSGSELYFPRLFSLSEMGATGIAVVNPGTTAATVAFTLRGANGTVLATASMPVAAGAQAASLISQLFPNATSPGWVSGISASPGLEAFWVGGDFSTFTDGASSAPLESLVVFPLITADTEISIANVAATADTTTLRVFDLNGIQLTSQNVTIPAGGVIQGKVTTLIPGVLISSSQPVYIMGLGQTTGSELVGTSVTRGFLVPQDSVVINGIMAADTDLSIPYLVDGPIGGSTYKTVLGVTNLGVNSATLVLTLKPANGPPVTVQRTLPPLGGLQNTVLELFGVTNVSGWVQLTSSEPMSAWAAYADLQGGGASIVPADAGSSSPLVFGHIADLNPWWTGIALLNATTATASVEVFAINPAGALIDGPATSPLARFPLAPGANRAFLLAEVVPATQSRTADGGFIVVRSTNGVPLSGLELFFLRNGRVFANVPGRPSPEFTHSAIPTLPVAVDITRAFTTDANDLEKCTYQQGERIQLKVDRNSTLAFEVTAQSRYTVFGPSGPVWDSSNSSITPPGPHRRSIEIVVPPTAPPGVYTFEGTVTYNGSKSTRSSTFTVTQSTGGAASVEVVRAFTVDGSSLLEKTSFSVNQPIGFVMERNNKLTTQVTVTARYRATGPSGFVLTDQTVSSAAPPGQHFRFVDTVIPASAPSGSYTFEATATYNGISSTRTSTFLVSGGTEAPPALEPDRSMFLAVERLRKSIVTERALPMEREK